MKYAARFSELINSSEYDFLRSNENLNNLILLTLGGSHAYGMNKEGSDVDLRGIALNSKQDILLGTDFEQVVDVDTDTTIYSFNKMLNLLSKCNPNTIEILGCRKDSYIVLSDVGRELIDNSHMFLSKVCIHTFGNYAGSQLRRLENKAARLVGQAQNEAYVLKSIRNAEYEFLPRYASTNDGFLKLYIDDASEKGQLDGYEKEIFMDVDLRHYPLRDYTGMWNEMKAIVSSYNKIGKRNEKAISHDKLGKHMAHLLRLYMMCIDILEKEEIITYREDEHDLLMSIRNGEYLDDNRQLTREFYDLLNEYESKFEEAKKHTKLPEKPDYESINKFKAKINEQIIEGII